MRKENLWRSLERAGLKGLQENKRKVKEKAKKGNQLQLNLFGAWRIAYQVNAF